ncbi:MAG: hypothetical protein RM338_11585 [Nostoc sp. DedQUE12a]|nr:hypothetical protein [Nostoc sp. DedQUE12a]
MCNQIITSPLISLLQAALNNPIERSRLLQQPEKIREIANDIPARQWLFQQACQTDDPNPAKDLIITMMKSSRLIWHGGRISPDVYSEALSRTWVWFLEHLCQRYNPEQASFVTWFNQKLRWMILEVIREIADIQSKELHSPRSEEDNEWIYPPAPERDRWHETIQEWLELVQNNSHLSACRMQSHPHVNCQVLLIDILKILGDFGEFSWNNLAQKYGVELSALRKFCKTRCFPLFKKLLSE